MPKPSNPPTAAVDDWDAQRRRVIGLGENSFRKSYYPELRRNVANVRNLVLAIEQSPRGIFICVRDGSVEYANGTLLQLTGCHADDLIGKPPQALWTKVIKGQGFPQAMAAIVRGEHWKDDLCLLNGQGEEIWVQALLAPILDDTGCVTHFLGSMEDISARKRMEEELAIVAQTRALEAAERLARLKSEFMNNMSHELRTPLFHILGLAKLASRAKDLDKAKDQAQKIADSGERLLQMVTSVLDFSAVEAGRLELFRERFPLQEMLDAISDKWRPRIEARSLEFHLEHPDTLPIIVADRCRVQQILEELLDNALKFTPTGTITLNVSVNQDAIDFRVSDTGVGMTPEQLNAALQPFRQVDGSATRHIGGLGLGLALAQHLTNLMGGHLTADCSPGTGSHLSVSLPRVEKVGEL